jgi:hypothetical protein
MSDTAAKIGNTVSDLAAQTAQTETGVQDKLDQGKGLLHDLRASGGEAMDKATARKASTVGGQAVARAGDVIEQAGDAIQGAAREAGNRAGQAATTLCQQGGRAGGYVSRYTADQPLTALLIAGALGYGLAYLIHRP